MRAAPERQEMIEAALRDFITGSGVERTKLVLTLEGRDITVEFIAELKRCGFSPTTVAGVDVKPGERVPAFLIQNQTAFFGWVFWEKFSHKKIRKLWGSVIRNRKGDWAIQIPPTKEIVIYANMSTKYFMDIEHPL
jgi:hypothetical protein